MEFIFGVGVRFNEIFRQRLVVRVHDAEESSAWVVVDQQLGVRHI